MRRRRGGDAAPAEACGVWLDTAELKRGPARPLVPRAPSRAAGRKQSPVLLPQPGSSMPRQSSILSFFSPLPDEGDKENCRPWEDPGVAPPAWPVKILPLPQLEGAQEEPPGAGQGLQGPAQAGQTPREPLGEPQRQSQGSPGAGGSSKARLSPGGRGSGGRRAEPCGRAGAGGTDPGPGADPGGVWGSAQSPGPAQPLQDRGQGPGEPCRQLQECQGSRGTALRDRDRDSPPRDSPPRASPRQPPELGSEPLFTQDSEGNRVIKHW